MERPTLHISPLAVIVYLVTLVLCVLPAIFINNLIGYAPGITVLLAGLLSIGYIVLVRKNVGFAAIDGNVSCQRGDQARMDLTLRNSGMLPVVSLRAEFFHTDLYGHVTASRQQIFTLAPHSAQNVGFSIETRHVGMFSAGVREISISDLLGLCSLSYLSSARTQVCVSPHLFAVSADKLAQAAVTESPRSTTDTLNENMDYSGVREYRFGDPIKNIHWKLSAHSREYVTKQHQDSSNPGVTIVADFHVPGDDSETMMAQYDCVAECALSYARACSDQGLDFEIVFEDETGVARRFVPTVFSGCSEWVAQLPTSDSAQSGTSTALIERCLQGYGYSSVVCCTANPHKKAIGSLISLGSTGKHVNVVYALPNTAYDQQRETLLAPLRQLDAVGIPYTAVCSAEELSGRSRK